jgi:RNA polymerase sigma-70 factor, ECF subfamily
VNPHAKTLPARAFSGLWRKAAEAPAGLATESATTGHSADMGMITGRTLPVSALETDAGERGRAAAPASVRVPDMPNGSPLAESPELTLAAVYEAHFDFVWRSARRLGVRSSYLDDVVQDVFVVVQRQLAGFEQRATLKSWLFGITRRVVRDRRRSARRRPTEALDSDPCDVATHAPDEQLAMREQAALLHALLETLDDDKREAFVLSELEQMSGPEIAAALALNLNTAYARVRAARLAFEAALERHEARERVRAGKLGSAP